MTTHTNNPELYRKLVQPHASFEALESNIEAFFKAVSALREVYGLADVAVVVSSAAHADGGPQRFISAANYGSDYQRTTLACHLLKCALDWPSLPPEARAGMSDTILRMLDLEPGCAKPKAPPSKSSFSESSPSAEPEPIFEVSQAAVATLLRRAGAMGYRAICKKDGAYWFETSPGAVGDYDAVASVDGSPLAMEVLREAMGQGVHFEWMLHDVGADLVRALKTVCEKEEKSP